MILCLNAGARQSTDSKKNGVTTATVQSDIKCIQFIYVHGTSEISDENIYHSRDVYTVIIDGGVVQGFSAAQNFNKFVDNLQQQPPAVFAMINYCVYFCYCIHFEIDWVNSATFFFYWVDAADNRIIHISNWYLSFDCVYGAWCCSIRSLSNVDDDGFHVVIIQ
jgi:hypothetical protein